MTTEEERIIAAYLAGTITPEEQQQLERKMQSDDELNAQVAAMRQSYEIEDYLEGQLNKEDAEAFEARLADDAQLRKAVEDYRAAEAIWQADQLQEDITMFEQISAEQSSKSRLRSFFRRFWWLNVVVLLVLGVGLFWMLSPNPGNISPVNEGNIEVEPEPPKPPDRKPQNNGNEDIPDLGDDNNLTPSDPPSIPRQQIIAQLNDYNQVRYPTNNPVMGASGLEAQLAKAWTAYQNGNDTEVISVLFPLQAPLIAGADTSDQHLEMLLLLSASYVHTGSYQPSLDLLTDDRLSFGITPYREEALWYQILALVNLEQYDEARQLIQDSALLEDAEYGSRLQQLLKLLPPRE